MRIESPKIEDDTELQPNAEPQPIAEEALNSVLEDGKSLFVSKDLRVTILAIRFLAYLSHRLC